MALRDGLKISTQNLKNIGVNIFGILINGAEKHSSSYYYYYYYDEKGKKKHRKKSKNILDYFRGNK
jgi:hypothetical protein